MLFPLMPSVSEKTDLAFSELDNTGIAIVNVKTDLSNKIASVKSDTDLIKVDVMVFKNDLSKVKTNVAKVENKVEIIEKKV